MVPRRHLVGGLVRQVLGERGREGFEAKYRTVGLDKGEEGHQRMVCEMKRG
jgi:hypothetical protein